jgi:hypothetical protein
MSDPEVNAQIAHLRTSPPVLERTRTDRIWDYVLRVCAPISVAALTLAVLVGLSGVATANCINTNLGTRSAPSARDAQAHIDFADAVLALYDTSLSGPDRSKRFHDAVARYKQMLIANQDARNAKPLGKC